MSQTIVETARWVRVAHRSDFPENGGIAVRIGARQIAVYNFADRGEWYACQNACPHKNDNVLARGIIGDKKSEPKVACPMHKKVFSLETGACLSDPEFRVETYAVRVENDQVYLQIAD